MISYFNTDIIFVVSPWTILDTPHLGLHLLQSIATQERYKTSVFYADQLFAKKIGLDKYRYISEKLLSQYELIQERLFAKVAYPNELPFLGRRISPQGISYTTPRSEYDDKIDWKILFSLENLIDEWVLDTAKYLASSEAKIIGFSISHQQTNASISLINNIKKINPDKIIIVGGSNCDGKMANGILSLSSNIDYVFSGKSELSLKQFLEDFNRKILPTDKVINSKYTKNINLDNLPIPNYDDYFKQIKLNNLDLDFWINIESSRGCWWGWKHQCKFCGVNGSYIYYNAKSPDRIFSEIKWIKEKYNVRNFRMVDTLMPRNYFKSLIPELGILDLNIFYEQRADITFEQMQALKNAGVNYIQIGIESLSLSHLNLINKGVTVAENINSLRYSYMLNIYNGWNLLYKIPNDDFEGWDNTLKLLPYIKHLPPPSYFRPVELARFSPYYEKSEEYGISNVKYFDVYDDIYPSSAKIESLAWLFEGTFNSASTQNPLIIKKIDEFIKDWISSWNSKEDRVYLTILKKDETLLLIDSRRLPNTKKIQIVNNQQASVALAGSNSKYFDIYKDWCIQNKLLIEVDNTIVPLSTCSSDIYEYIVSS